MVKENAMFVMQKRFLLIISLIVILGSAAFKTVPISNSQLIRIPTRSNLIFADKNNRDNKAGCSFANKPNCDIHTTDKKTDDNTKRSLNFVVASFLLILPIALLPLSNAHAASSLSLKSEGITPPDVINILKDKITVLRSGVTGEKIGQLRVGDRIYSRIGTLDYELNDLQTDVYTDDIDWDVLGVYPKVFRAYSPLFTAYTDRAFPSNDPVDVALRYALRYEVGSFYNGVKDLEDAIAKQSQRQAQRSFARMSLSYDHYLKAGDLFVEYDKSMDMNTDAYNGNNFNDLAAGTNLNFVAPSIEAPGLQDEVLLIKGPDKGRRGTLLWISKGSENIQAIVKFLPGESSGHSEVKSYPYSLVAKTTPPQTLFVDDFLAAYAASAISSGIMYPIDSFKTRAQSGRRGFPTAEEGGIASLWRGVFYFIADANDAVYVASYGLLKPVFLAPINLNDPVAVFWTLVFTGSVGDAIGSIFRLPMEIVVKQIQTGMSTDGAKVLTTFFDKSGSTRLLVLSWAAILCRDMPFAGLQIALFDVFKGLFSFLDDLGWSVFAQRALWGAFAGGTAGLLTTPFDVITTSVMTAAEGGGSGGSGGSGDSESELAVPASPSYTTNSTLIPAAVTLEGDASGERVGSSSSSTTVASFSTIVFNPLGIDLSLGPLTMSQRRVSSPQPQQLLQPGSQKQLQATISRSSTSSSSTSSRSSSRSISSSSSDGDSLAEAVRQLGPIFSSTVRTVLEREGPLGLFNGALPRMLFFSPAAMIFFVAYESLFDVIETVRSGDAFWQK